MKFTQQLSMHLNGGREFSELHYNIFADDKPTTLKRLTRTNGSPGYIKTQDVIWDTARPDEADAMFDVLASKGVGLSEWILKYAEKYLATTDRPP